MSKIRFHGATLAAAAMLAIGLGIHAGANVQSGDDAVRSTIVGKLGLVIAGSNAAAGIRQITEIVTAEGNPIILDLTIRFSANGRARRRRRTQTETGVGHRRCARLNRADGDRSPRADA